MNRIGIIVCLFLASCYGDVSTKYKQVRRPSPYVDVKSKDDRLEKNYPNIAIHYNKLINYWPKKRTELLVSTSKGDAHVMVSGPKNAPAVILLHGMYATSAMWYPNIKTLSRRFRVYTIDFLNEPNKSIAWSELKSSDDVVRWYAEVLDYLQLEKVNIVGASKGGWIGANIAMKYPNRVNKLVLLSPAQTFIWIPPSIDYVENVIFDISPDKRKVKHILSTMSSNVGNIDPDFVELFYYTSDASRIDRTVLAMKPFTKSQLKTFYTKTLVLIGDQDMINSSKTIQKVNENLPNGVGKIIYGAGHFLSIDQPIKVDKEIIDFLK